MREDYGRGRVRVSDADRARARAKAAAMAAQGLIRDPDELNQRLQQIDSAQYDDEIRAALADLPDTVRTSDALASDADREDAIRRIRLHESSGQLLEEEATRRILVIEKARTRASIAAVVSDLPAVERPSAPRRISQRDRDEALDQISEAFAQGRVSSDERELATAQIMRAHSRQELNAAFRGLTKPTVTVARNKARAATNVSGRAVAEGGRRARSALLRWVAAIAVAIVGIVILILGNHLVGGILLVLGVLIWGSSVFALFTSRRP